MQSSQFDLIFADTWSRKFDHLGEALGMLRPSGLSIIDDLLPQPNWLDGHAPKVPRLIDAFERNLRLKVSKLCWSLASSSPPALRDSPLFLVALLPLVIPREAAESPSKRSERFCGISRNDLLVTIPDESVCCYSDEPK